MLEVFDFTFLNSPVSYILSFCIIITITYAEGPLMFFLYISNSFLNTILPNPGKSVNHSLPRRCLERFKIKCPKHPLSSRNTQELCIQYITSIQGTKLSGNSAMNYSNISLSQSRLSEVLSYMYNTYESFIAVETYYIIIVTQNRICFGILIK